ncbi:MAG: hypothetical protein AABX54_00045 [Nanoarchaeota archaeon]
MNEEEFRKLGEEAELRFKEWLERHKIPYLYIQQDSDTFSSVFRYEDYGKRPDFIVLLPNFGFIFVDVKNKKLDSQYRNYCIDAKETRKYSSFQRKFNLQIWYVISNEDYDFKTWFWIPISKVLESRIKKCTSNISGDDFYPISPEEFIQISDSDSIYRIFSKDV